MSTQIKCDMCFTVLKNTTLSHVEAFRSKFTAVSIITSHYTQDKIPVTNEYDLCVPCTEKLENIIKLNKESAL